MATEILMPALSPTMEEGTLAKWLVKEGDAVKSGQILAEIETDKATMEFEAVDEGIVGKLLVAEGTVVTMDGDRRVLESGAVAVRGNRIVAVGDSAALSERYSAARTISARGMLVLPGLVNTHTHAPMVLFRGIANDVSLMDWLQHYIFPAEARTVTRDFVEWGTALACLEMIRSGTAEEVQAVAARYFKDDTLSIAVLEPQAVDSKPRAASAGLRH